jgi:hypothetical protein
VKTVLRYLVTTYVMAMTNDLADARGALLPDKFQPLPDLGFDFVPQIPELARLVDPLLTALYAAVLLRIALSPTNRRELACAFVEMHMSLMLLRCLTVTLTTLPSPVTRCTYALKQKPALLFLEPLYHMVRPDGMLSWCHDMVFSGHTMFYTIAALFLHDARGHWAFRFWAYATLLGGVFCLIAARIHYSVDIGIALIIAVLFYLNNRHEFCAYLAADPQSAAAAATSTAHTTSSDETSDSGDEMKRTKPLLSV